MRSFAVTSALLSIATVATAQNLTATPVTGLLGDAIVKTGNPQVTYVATLPEDFWSYPGPQGNVRGSIQATAGEGGVGVNFDVSFENLPAVGGPFMYHLHVLPVPANGNCTATLAHQDQYIRGEVPPCDPALPETCQDGDLSGKHGMVTSDPFKQTYTDNFVSLIEGDGSFFGNRSIVFHFANKTRITCANFVRVTGNAGNGTTPTNGTNPTATPTASPTFVPANAATGNMVSAMYVLGLAGLTAFFL